MRKIMENMGGMYAAEPVKKKSSGSVKSSASNDIYVDISEESANMVAITLKGRTAVIPADRAKRLAEKLLNLAGTLTEDEPELEEEKKIGVHNNFGIEPAEKHTRHDPPGTDYGKNVSARKGMVG